MTYPTCSYQSIGIPESVALITKVVREALSGGGVSPQDCAGCCVGMPCYGENPANDREIVRLLTDALTPVPVYVVNDGEVGWAGSLACGRESILFPAQVLSHLDAGVTRIYPLWGVGGVFGDEAPADWIGRQGMSLFSKEADGRLPRGPLYELVHGEFGLTEDYQFIDRIVREFAPYREKVAGFQRYVLQAARAGDTAAAALYETAALELALMIRTLKAKLRFSAEPISVSYSGGIFHAGEFILAPLRKKAEELNCILCEPKYSATEGALMLAMERFPLSPS